MMKPKYPLLRHLLGPQVYASGTFTAGGDLADAETVTIGGKVYTFKSTLSDTDGFVLLGADDAAALANLFAAINLGAGAGTLYAAATVANPHVVATGLAADELVVKSKVDGTIGNFIPTDASADGMWAAGTLEGGTGSLSDALRNLLAEKQVSADVYQAILDLTDPDANE